MPGVMTFTKKDGTSFTSQVKWLPEELARMDSQELIEVLEQTKQFALRFHDEYEYPLRELRALPSEKTLSRRLIGWWALLIAVPLVFAGMAAYDVVGHRDIPLGQILSTPGLLIVFIVAIAQIRITASDRRAVRRVGGPEGIRLLRQAGERYLASPEGCSAYVVWGEECTNFTRHEGAIQALRSGWASTLEEAKRHGGSPDDYMKMLREYRKNKKTVLG